MNECGDERVKAGDLQEEQAYLGYQFSPSVTLGGGTGKQSGTDELVVTSAKPPSLIWNSQ